MSTSSAPDDDLLLAALEAAEQGLPLSAEAQARLKADAAFAADFHALQSVSGLMRQDAAWGQSSGTDAPPPHLLGAILQAEVAARPDAIRQAVVAKDAPTPARAWWQRLSSFVVGGGVVVGAAAALLITVQRSPDEAPAAVALQAPQTELAEKVATDPATGQATGGLDDQLVAKLDRSSTDKKAANVDTAVATPSDDADAPEAKAEASVGGDIADAALLAKGNRADIGAGGGLGAGRGAAGPEREARRERLGDLDGEGDGFAFGLGSGLGSKGVAKDDARVADDFEDVVAPPPPPAELAQTTTTTPEPTMAPKAPSAPPAAAAPKPTAPASSSSPSLSRSAPEEPAADEAPRIISADESRRAFLERQRKVAELKATSKKKAVDSSKEKAKSSKSAGSSSSGYGPGDASPDAVREQMLRDRQLQEANTLLLTAERELGFARYSVALDFAARSEAIAGGGLGLAPASTQVRAFLGLQRFADAARLASRLLNGSAADPQLIDGMLAGATAAENIGDFRLAERLLHRAASADNPDAARRQQAQTRLQALRGNANMAPAKRAAERAAAEPAAAAVDEQ